MHINNLTPPKGLRDGPGNTVNDYHKKHHLMDDDDTFMPPALSAYSVALLSDKSSPNGQHISKQQKLSNDHKFNRTPSQITGIYEIDFPENNHSKNNLKNKLSVHFKDSHSSSPITSSHFLSNHNSNNNSNHSSHHHSDKSRHSSIDNVSHNSINDIQLNSNHNYNTSLHNSFNMSNNNFTNNHTHNTTTEDNDDLLDASLENSIKFLQPMTSTTTPATSRSSTAPRPTSSGSSSQYGSLKRSRLARRLRSLGPPKRASQISETPKSNSSSDQPHKPVLNENVENIENDKKFSTPPLVSSRFSPNLKSSLVSKSNGHPAQSFLRALEKLQSESPSQDLFSEQKELEIRSRVEEQKKLNELEHQLSKSKTIQSIDLEFENLNKNVPGSQGNELFQSKNSDFPVYSDYKRNNKFDNKVFENKENLVQVNKLKHQFSTDSLISNQNHVRAPLNNVPINTFNVFNENDTFRKPKTPRPFNEHVNELNPPTSQQHIEAQPPRQESQQLPPTASSHSTNFGPSSAVHNLPDEIKKRKSIIINGNLYEKLELLGRGGSSKVYKVKALFNNKLYAIKKVTFDQFEESCIKGFKGEIDLLLKLKNADRVVKLVDHAIGESSVYLVMECGDIDLAHVFQNKLGSNQLLDINFIRFHSIEMLKCVQAVHEAEIVHSDLKPANFLFVKGILKIIDFGIANAVPDHTANIYRESQIGTPNYMAPEALTEVNQSLTIPEASASEQLRTWKVGKPSDVWSCGCIIYQMIYGRPPYAGYSAQQRITAIMNPQIKIQYPSKGLGGIKVPVSAIELIQKCLERNPNDRWTIEECLTSDFLNPKVVSETFVRDLVHLAVNFGYKNHQSGTKQITDEVYDKLVDTVLKQIEDLHYA